MTDKELIGKLDAMVKALQQSFGKLGHDDLDDALTCALLANLFDMQPDTLVSPVASVPDSEGWIWVPKDALHGLCEMRS